jgi:hypothetical protein
MIGSLIVFTLHCWPVFLQGEAWGLLPGEWKDSGNEGIIIRIALNPDGLFEGEVVKNDKMPNLAGQKSLRKVWYDPNTDLFHGEFYPNGDRLMLNAELKIINPSSLQIELKKFGFSKMIILNRQ